MRFKKKEEEIREELRIATSRLHNNILNEGAHGRVNELRDKMRGIEKRNTKGVAIYSRVKWEQIGDKCSRQFFQVVQ